VLSERRFGRQAKEDGQGALVLSSPERARLCWRSLRASGSVGSMIVVEIMTGRQWGGTGKRGGAINLRVAQDQFGANDSREAV